MCLWSSGKSTTEGDILNGERKNVRKWIKKSIEAECMERRAVVTNAVYADKRDFTRLVFHDKVMEFHAKKN